MNDNETKVMAFTAVRDMSLVLSDGTGTHTFGPLNLLSSDTDTITPSAGRVYFAGMMFDRMRIRSISVVLRPKVMPSSTATNYVVYAAWDRYSGVNDGAVETSYSIRTDPSAKQVVWTPGGSGTPLRTWIYSTNHDRYQYLPISHNVNLSSWILNLNGVREFFPTLLVAIEAVTAPSTPVQFTVQSRVTVEFQGGYSNTTLNYTPSTAAAAASARALTPDEIPNAQVTEL